MDFKGKVALANFIATQKPGEPFVKVSPPLKAFSRHHPGPGIAGLTKKNGGLAIKAGTTTLRLKESA